MPEYTPQIPSWLKHHIYKAEKNSQTKLYLCSTAQNTKLELWYYGDLFLVEKEKRSYIVAAKAAPIKLMAHDPQSREWFLIFDGAKQGYTGLFCNAYPKQILQNRPLKQYPVLPSELVLCLEYGIDYDAEDEIEDYCIDEQQMVLLVDNRKMLWQDVHTDGVTGLALYYKDEQGNLCGIVAEELA